jgi:Bax protein
MANFKIVARTLMTVIVVAFCAVTFHFYVEQGNAKAEELKPKLPNFEHNNNQQFLDNVVQCVYYIEHTTPDIHTVNLELLLAQAALESGWGNSRFAKEGKNLFGIRTYKLTEPHMLPSNNPKKWGVKVYQHECDSVLNYINVLNNGSAYENYRRMREDGIDDPYLLVETLDAYAADKNYFSKVKSILKKIKNEYIIKEKK